MLVCGCDPVLEFRFWCPMHKAAGRMVILLKNISLLMQTFPSQVSWFKTIKEIHVLLEEIELEP